MKLKMKGKMNSQKELRTSNLELTLQANSKSTECRPQTKLKF